MVEKAPPTNDRMARRHGRDGADALEFGDTSGFTPKKPQAGRGGKKTGKLLLKCLKNRIGAKRRRVMPRLLKGGAPGHDSGIPHVER